MVQMTESHLLVLDAGNHCIDLVNRALRRLHKVMSKCGVPGYWNDRLSAARVAFPNQITKLNKTHAYFTEYFTRRLRTLYRSNNKWMVGTLRTLTGTPGSMTIDPSNKHIYMAAYLYSNIELVRLSINNGENVTLASLPQKETFLNENRTAAGFGSKVSLLSITNNVLFVSNNEFHKIRVIEIIRPGVVTISTICTGELSPENSEKKKPIDGCSIAFPGEMLRVDQYTVLVSSIWRLHAIQLYGN